MKFKFVYIILIVLQFSCNEFLGDKDTKEGDVLLAEMGEKQLYLSYFSDDFFKKYSKEDSLIVLKKEVRNWVKTESVVAKSLLSIDNFSSIESEADRYKNALTIASYEEEVIKNLDSELSEEDLMDYYENHKDYFLFKKRYYEIKYIIIPRNNSNLSQLKNGLNKNEESYWITNYCMENKNLCHVDQSQIKDKAFLLNELKLSDQMIVTKYFRIQYMDSERVMIYRIEDVKEKGEVADFSFVKEEVQRLAVHRYKQEFLEELKEQTYQKAKNDKKFEIYIP